MKPADLFSRLVDRITQAEDKLPIFLFAIPVFTCLYWMAYYVLYLFFGYIAFFAQIGTFFHTVSRSCFFLLGIYMILLYLKGKVIFHAAAGAALIIRSFLPFVSYNSYGANWGLLFICLICGLLIAAPSVLSQREDEKTWGMWTAIIVGGFFLLNLIISFIPTRTKFIWTSLSFILLACYLLRLLFLLTLVIHDTDQLGGVLGYVQETVDRFTGRGAEVQHGAHESRGTYTGSHVENGTYSETTDYGSEAVRSTEFSEQTPVSEPSYGNVDLQEAVSQAVIQTSASSTGRRKQYKTVAGPTVVTVSRKDSYDSGVKQYAAIIDRETVGGWKLDSIYEIPVTKKAGCLASLFGQRDVTVFFNMLIFSKEE